jgi:RNA polymerase sigma-70 factor (ECF subfamily)
LRSYLLAALKNFLANERSRSLTIKRGEGRPPIPLHDLMAHRNGESEPASHLSAEQIFERRWALSMLEQVFARLEEEYHAMNKESLFARFKSFIADDDRQSQAEIGREFSMSKNAVKQAFHRFRQRYREILRAEVARTVAAPGDVEAELRHLIAVLRA